MSFGSVPEWIHAAPFSLAILIGFTIAAYFLNLTRLYIYGVMIALSPLAGEWLYNHSNVPHHGLPALLIS